MRLICGLFLAISLLSITHAQQTPAFVTLAKVHDDGLLLKAGWRF
jgi:hypothetical protein